MNFSFFQKLAIAFDFLRLPKSAWQNRTLLYQLVKRNISIRYQGSILGLLWSFAHPLLMLCVYTFVFSVVFQARWGTDTSTARGAFAIVMFCGISIYTIFAECISGCCTVITSNPNFVKKIIFPLEILPLAQCLSSFVLGMVWFLLLFLGCVLVLGNLSFTMLLLPLILFPLFLFAGGISYFVASLNVYLKDTLYVVQVMLQILFFLTPIFYPLQAVPAPYRLLLEVNPLTILIEQARMVFLYGSLPQWSFLGIACLVSLLVFHFGFVWFYKTKKGFSDVL